MPASAVSEQDAIKLDKEAYNLYGKKDYASAGQIWIRLMEDPDLPVYDRAGFEWNAALALHATAVETVKNKNHPILLDACRMARHALANGSPKALEAKNTGSWWPDCFMYGDRLYVDTDGVIRIRGTASGGAGASGGGLLR